MSDNIQSYPSVVAAIKAGRKIEAIKLLREATGLGLKEAKDLVDCYDAQGYADFPDRPVAEVDSQSLQFDQAIVDALNRGRKIEAIKLLRQASGIGLKEAKDLVDRYCAENRIEVSSAGESSVLSYLAGLLVLGLLGYFAYKLIV